MNANADALSRLPLTAIGEDISQNVTSAHMLELVQAPVTEKDVAGETASDQILSRVLKYINSG